MDFTSATHLLSYHRGMLADEARTAGFQQAIREVVKPGDVVVDLGAGTGILSFFAARAGAKRVYAIDAGEIVAIAELLRAANGLDDRVTLLNRMSYEVELPERADVLVSETLWNFGLGEGIIGYIRDARERFLRPRATLVPGDVELIASPVEHARLYHAVAWPKTLHGVALGPVHPFAANNVHFAALASSDLLAEPAPVARVEFATVQSSDVSGDVTTVARRRGTMHGIGGWFRSRLSPSVSLDNGVPKRTPSWAHAFFPLEEPSFVDEGDEIRIRIATTVNGSVWRWRVDTPAARFDQSTFWGFPPPRGTMARRAPDYVPRLTERGRAELFVLERLDGTRTVADLEGEFAAAFPDLFHRERERTDFVREITERYG